MKYYSDCETILKILNNSNKAVTATDDLYARSILRAISLKYGRNYLNIITLNKNNLQAIDVATITIIFDLLYTEYRRSMTGNPLYFDLYYDEITVEQYSAIICRMLARLLVRLTDEKKEVKFEF